MTIQKIVEKIEDYKKDRNTYIYGKVIGFIPRRPGRRYSKTLYEHKRLGLNAKHLAQWFSSVRPDAKISIDNSSIYKERNLDNGVAWTRGEYNTIEIKIEVDGKTFRHSTAETYRRNHEILDFMLEHVK